MLLSYFHNLDTYYTYSGDIDFLKNFWPNYTKAVEFLDAKVDSSAGLLSATGAEDWGRLNSGGINAPANAIYYRVSGFRIYSRD